MTRTALFDRASPSRCRLRGRSWAEGQGMSSRVRASAIAKMPYPARYKSKIRWTTGPVCGSGKPTSCGTGRSAKVYAAYTYTYTTHRSGALPCVAHRHRGRIGGVGRPVVDQFLLERGVAEPEGAHLAARTRFLPGRPGSLPTANQAVR
jgi:hypothetical protein